jgi:hypothetical protein
MTEPNVRAEAPTLQSSDWCEDFFKLSLPVESQQAWRALPAPTHMSRNFYILAAALGLFALISTGMSMVPSSFQPGLPANGSLWRTVAMFLLLFALAAAFIGVMSHLFEQVDRRSEEARQSARRRRRGERDS